jgi:predicted nucleic acid-binding protein
MEIVVKQCHVTAVSEVNHENHQAACPIAARKALYSFYDSLLISAVERNNG